ncbi:MAG: FHA domain-containing protein, partial [Deltaproteobacteria bacterium]|nr:FHA domain-containing protein [Deltaproteobacteria bacterium]
MKAKLITKKQNDILGTYTIDSKPFTIGRGQENSLVINEPHISRAHVKLEWKEDKLILTRLSPTGKLIVDGKNTERQELFLELGGDPGHHQKTLSFEIPPYSFTLSLERGEEEVLAEPSFPFLMSEEAPEEAVLVEKRKAPSAEETKITARPIKAKLIVLQGLSPHTSYDLLGEEIILGRDAE